MADRSDSRRLFVTGLSALAVLHDPVRLLAGEVMKEIAALKPGEFT